MPKCSENEVYQIAKIDDMNLSQNSKIRKTTEKTNTKNKDLESQS